MNKWLTNNCEDGGVCMIKTRPFKPVSNYLSIINTINALYSDNRSKPNDTLFTYEEYDDQIILTGSTYLLQMHDDVYENYGDASEMEEGEITTLLKNEQVPEYLRWHIVSACLEGAIPLGNLVDMLVAPNQSIEVQITDTIYENSSYIVTT